jgi:hypothetical protein
MSVLEQRMDTDKKEVELLQRVYHRLNPCVACAGYGKIANHVDQDTTKLEKCGNCDGTGVENGKNS